MKNCVYFAHGKESGPWGTKIQHLAAVAKEKGFEVESPDYSHEMDPEKRVEQLLALKPLASENLVLVGSSMGGYVSTVASQILKPKGLFLLAPAFYIPGYTHQSPVPNAELVQIIHGWHDDVVPPEHSIRFAQAHNVHLQLLNSDHRLTSVISLIEKLFGLFLEEVLK